MYKDKDKHKQQNIGYCGRKEFVYGFENDFVDKKCYQRMNIAPDQNSHHRPTDLFRSVDHQVQ